ncbi:MAG: aldehyde dehydrogenase EutE [Candidatus Latescibacteria bacterium]|nr:aldehyde dehydrogenase EutE [Candidatus Latescibacterota bacterium]
MNIDERQIQAIVQQVIAELGLQAGRPAPPSHGQTGGQYGQFTAIEDAIAAAQTAFHQLQETKLELRATMIEGMRQAILDNLELLAKMAAEETKIGNWQDKIKKNRVAAEKTPGLEDLRPDAVTGDHGLTVTELAPYGVIGSITPMTNPSETVINNGICMIAAGNAVVFNAHPLAKRVTMKAVELVNQAIVRAGGPDNLLTGVTDPTLDTAGVLMKDPRIRLLVVTGGGGVVKAAMSSGKKVIAAGPGNPPVVVDETADLVKAAQSIVDGASVDNNICCTSEKEIIVVDAVADDLKRHMKAYKTYELAGSKVDALLDVIFDRWRGVGCKDAVLNRKFVGQEARTILSALGITAPDDIRLILVETPKDHPLVWKEQMMPVIPLVRVRDADEAIQFAKEVEQGCGHTAVMHSRNIEKLSKMARSINTTIFVKNGPSYAGLGFGGEGPTCWTIASPTGEGPTTPRTYTRPRRCVLVDSFRIV